MQRPTMNAQRSAMVSSTMRARPATSYKPIVMRLTVLLSLSLIVTLQGCASAPPVAPAHYGKPALLEIHQAFERTVAAARRDPEVRWRSGWAGNVMINSLPGNHRGLCYQWQSLVYAGVLPTVKQVGWHANGIVINQGTRHEHHAVVVFDPAVTDQNQIVADPHANPAWVLDAWRRGEADVFTVQQWVALPWFQQVPPKITGVSLPDQH